MNGVAIRELSSYLCVDRNLTKFLIKCGIDVNARNANNMTPLDVLSGYDMCSKTRNALKTLLIDAGGKLNGVMNKNFQDTINFRENARIASITCIGIGRIQCKRRDVMMMIARAVWALRAQPA
jgi:hypothetical protein